MNFKRNRGEPNIQPYIKKASTTMNFGDAVYVDANGFVLPVVGSTTPSDVIGIVQETIATTDADYATAREIAVDVAEKGDNGDWWEAVVGAGTPAQTNVGEAHDFFTGGAGIDLTGTTYKQLKVQRILGSTSIIVSFTGVPQTNVS